jgi:hypothetical protein
MVARGVLVGVRWWRTIWAFSTSEVSRVSHTYRFGSFELRSMDELTSAPSVASFHAMAAPIPRADPVTRAVLPRRGRPADPSMSVWLCQLLKLVCL